MFDTAWKVSKYGVISGLHFLYWRLNTGKYGPEITPYLNTFHAVWLKVISNKPLSVLKNVAGPSTHESKLKTTKILITIHSSSTNYHYSILWASTYDKNGGLIIVVGKDLL